MPLIVRELRYLTPGKAYESVDVVGSRSYMWASCEERKENVG